MSEFKCEVVRLTIEPHPNADRLEIAKVGKYRSVVGKGDYWTGDLAVYIPEAAIVPDDVIEDLGLTGRLAGKQKNRVKAVRLRGVLSQGIVHPLNKGRLKGYMRERWLGSLPSGIDPEWGVGGDMTEVLGIEKYVPPIPTSMSGEVFPSDYTLKYDIENWKRYPDLIAPGTQVVVTEKLHGTFFGVGWNVGNRILAGPLAVFSKGLGTKGLALKFNDANANNIYIWAFKDHLEGLAKIARCAVAFGVFCNPDKVFVLGEIYGRGVQDLHYGTKERRLRIFDMAVQDAGETIFLSWDDMAACALAAGLETVPLLDRGEWDPEAGLQDGDTVLGGEHIREGIVFRPVKETRDEVDGSAAYSQDGI